MFSPNLNKILQLLSALAVFLVLNILKNDSMVNLSTQKPNLKLSLQNKSQRVN